MSTEIAGTGGVRRMTCTRDSEGHREYQLTQRIKCGVRDGPANVLRTSGLAIVGVYWLVDDDVDLWAWCRPDATVVPVEDDGQVLHYDVTQTFSTKPLRNDAGRNQFSNPNYATGDNLGFENPLLEPPRIGGRFVKFLTEATHDRFGRPIRNSAHEPIRGPQNEWDDGRDQVTITVNEAFLDIGLLSSLKNTVNSIPMWGFPPRCVKLTDYTWEVKFHGVIGIYYTVTLTFETNPKTWDRDIQDEGTMVLHGQWDRVEGSDTYHQWVVATDPDTGEELDSSNPRNFIRFKDWHDENTRVILNGDGRPFDPEQDPVYNDTGFASPGGTEPLTTATTTLAAPTGLTATLSLGGSLRENFAHSYVVSAFDASGETLPSAVAGVVTTTTHLSVRLTWAAVPGAIGYKIYRVRGAVESAFKIISSVGSVSTPGSIHVEKYPEANYLILGIPALL